jgi:DNA-binding transcriptional regulator YiaG
MRRADLVELEHWANDADPEAEAMEDQTLTITRIAIASLPMGADRLLLERLCLEDIDTKALRKELCWSKSMFSRRLHEAKAELKNWLQSNGLDAHALIGDLR